jgi:dTDP-4-dehydrorhamnose 3,5-epimerase
MIAGVVFRDLVTHADDRGFFREIVRATDPAFDAGFGQLSHSLVYPGIVKAWHAHRVQTQWTYVAAGLLHVVLHDARKDSPTAGDTGEWLVGEHQPSRVYMFPPGVLHGYRCVAGPAHVIYVTSGVYDLDDEVRVAADDPSVPFDWRRERPIR